MIPMAKPPSPGRDKFNAADIATRAVPTIRAVINNHQVLSDLIERLDQDFPAAAGTWDDLIFGPVAEGKLDTRPAAAQVDELARGILHHARAMADGRRDV